MRHEEIVGQVMTQTYSCLIKNEVLLKYPNFFFERGSIIYDYDNELYVFVGYTEEEQMILNEAALQLNRN